MDLLKQCTSRWQACAHGCFDSLREEQARCPDGQPLPPAPPVAFSGIQQNANWMDSEQSQLQDLTNHTRPMRNRPQAAQEIPKPHLESLQAPRTSST